MIVWSKGLGKMTLEMELEAAKLRVDDKYLAMDGTIESVCWNYTIRLYPNDLRDFLMHLANPKTVRFLAEQQRGVLLPFVLNLLVLIPKLCLNLLMARVFNKQARKD
ncbi:MAG: hypothetical protein PHQ05_01185 [Sterolibacterium sp.]|nr:hypothetical protein [Sterolibacterium sp.]